MYILKHIATYPSLHMHTDTHMYVPTTLPAPHAMHTLSSRYVRTEAYVCTHHIACTTCNAHTIFSFINTRSYTLPPGCIHYLPLDYCSNWCHAHTPQMQREKEGVGRGRSFSLCNLSKITNTHTNECSYVPVCTQYLQCLAMLSNAILHVALHITHNYQLSIHT